MTKLIGTGNNQVPTNGMLGGMSFQSPEDVKVDKIQENDFNVVSQTDIGTAPNQIPLNGMLGTAAYSNMEISTGSWTPSLLFDLASEPTYNWRAGFYQKIGNLVNVVGSMGIANNGQTFPASSLYIGGFPYNFWFPEGDAFFYVPIHGYTWQTGYGDSGDNVALFLGLTSAYNNLNHCRIDNGKDKTHANNLMITPGQRITFSFIYQTNQ